MHAPFKRSLLLYRWFMQMQSTQPECTRRPWCMHDMMLRPIQLCGQQVLDGLGKVCL